jgi:predicted  nucleic acid-binding Zn-ribbon protein
MSDLKENIYQDLGLIQLRQKLHDLNEEISQIDTQILQLAQRKSYLQSDLCNLNQKLSVAQSLLEPKNDE